MVKSDKLEKKVVVLEFMAFTFNVFEKNINKYMFYIHLLKKK